jgi:hypothetical protein
MTDAVLSPGKLPTEVAFIAIPFSTILAEGVKITSATVAITVIKGTDPDVATMKSSSALVSTDGLSVSQKITGGKPGCHYRLDYHAVCDDTSEPEVRVVLTVVSNRLG